jgi:hypothetical protein
MLKSWTAHDETIQTLLQTANKAPTYDRSRTLKRVGSLVESLEETLNCFIYEIGSKVQNRSEAVLTHHSDMYTEALASDISITPLMRLKTSLSSDVSRSDNLRLEVASVCAMVGPAVAIDRSIVPARISLAVRDQRVATDELTDIATALGLPLAVLVAVPIGSIDLHLYCCQLESHFHRMVDPVYLPQAGAEGCRCRCDRNGRYRKMRKR